MDTQLLINRLPLSSSHCFIFRPVFQGKVWKYHSKSQRRTFFQYPQSSGSHPLNCSLHNHIKRFRKSGSFLFLLLLCFSFAEQCPSATGSHNSPPVCAQLTSTPHPTLAISFSSSGPGPLPHLVPLSERRQHAQGCSQSKHAHLSIWMIASIIWETLFFPNQFNSCVLIVEQRWHLFCLLEWVHFSFFFFLFVCTHYCECVHIL